MSEETDDLVTFSRADLRKWGAKGGRARAQRLSQEQRSESARRAGQASAAASRGKKRRRKRKAAR